MQDPMNPLVDYSKIYETVSGMTDLADLGEAEKFWYNPQSESGQQFQQAKNQQAEQQSQQAMQQQQAEMQMAQAQLAAQQQLAQAESIKANAQLENGRMKNEVEAVKANAANQIDQLEAQIKALKDSQDHRSQKSRATGTDRHRSHHQAGGSQGARPVTTAGG